MKISLSIPEEFTVVNHGYGVICEQIVLALQRAGHTVPYKDPAAPVEVSIGQPYHWLWSSKDSYKIGMVAWESDKIPDSWHSHLKTADEIWTFSPQIAEWFAAYGYKTKVYMHGIDTSFWTRKRRRLATVDGGHPVRFLHIGEPAQRKGGQIVFNVFKDLFGNKPNKARLTIKGHGYSTVRGDGNAHPHKQLNNVNLITSELPQDLLLELIHRHDVLVYPSYGEGFGLIPLQAMATGMPVICTEAWAPYKAYILPELRIKSKLDVSPWPQLHPGNMYHPAVNQVADAMMFCVNNFDTLSPRAYANSFLIEKEFDWDKLTAEAFAPIVEKFGS